MSQALDLLLDKTREPEPFDEAFVQRVMRDVRTDELRRSGRRWLRRPVVMGLAAAVVAAGGAVAAVVGTNLAEPEREAARPRTSAVVTASDEPRVRTLEPGAAPGAAEGAETTAESAVGSDSAPLTDHTSFVLDPKTGLRLETDTHTTDFGVSRPQRVTLTLANTGKYPIAISGPKGCTLQVMAVPAGDDRSSGLDPASGDRFEWVCAGSDEDPRVQAAKEQFVLEPGQRTSSVASITLDRNGGWNVVGTCRCSYKQVQPAAVPKNRDPLTELTSRALPSPLIPESSDGKNLSTPAIRVRAS